jgi:hypothetical protein
MNHFQEAMHFFYKKHFRQSWFFTVFIEIGIVFFSIVKLFQGKQKSKPLPESYILYSSNIK